VVLIDPKRICVRIRYAGPRSESVQRRGSSSTGARTAAKTPTAAFAWTQPELRLHVGILNVNTSSHVPQDETYVGPRAFSEPEARAVRNLVAVELFSGVLTITAILS
jgi:hypothetical protein